MAEGAEAFEKLIRRWDASEARAAEHHRALLERHTALLERQERSERHFITAMSDIEAGMQRNTERLDDMADAIRANTRAVLTVLDRLEPQSG